MSWAISTPMVSAPTNPETVGSMNFDLLKAAGERAQLWTWRDASGGFLRALEVEGVKIADGAYVAGHSLGEYSALCAAGAFTISDAARLLRLRGQAMQAAVPVGEGAMAAKYRNSGQTCVCTNRFYVQAGVYDEFAEKLAKKAGSLKVGPGTEEGTQQGPLIDMAAVEKVEELIADAVSKGGKVLAGGNRHAKPAGALFAEIPNDAAMTSFDLTEN